MTQSGKIHRDEICMKSSKSKRERRGQGPVRVMFEREHLDVARQALEQAGVSPGGRDQDAALSVFAIGLGVLTGHYNEVLATSLRDAHIEAFGPEGPALFKEAAMRLHVATTMSGLASALLESDVEGNRHEAPDSVQ